MSGVLPVAETAHPAVATGWRHFAIVVLLMYSPISLADDARMVGKGVISTTAVEYGATVDPREGTLYFVRSDAAWGSPGCGRILASTPNGSEWSTPVPFLSGDGICYGDPFVSPDGQLFLFTSDSHDDPKRKDDDIWFMQRTQSGWSKPSRIEAVNSVDSESSPVLTRSGTLYFSSSRPGGAGAGDLWLAIRSGKHFARPESLGRTINTEHGEWNLFVDPDETYLLFESSGRANAMSPAGDLYRSSRKDGEWTKPVPITSINTTGSELMPRPSLDGRSFYFTRSIGKDADIFVVPANTILQSLAPGP